MYIIAINIKSHPSEFLSKNHNPISLQCADTSGGSGIVYASDIKGFIWPRLKDDQIKIIGHDLCCDMVVMSKFWPELSPLIIEKYQKGLVGCTRVRERLIQIATDTVESGDYAPLSRLCRNYLGVDPLQTTPTPPNYAAEILGIYQAQGKPDLPNELAMCQAAFALESISVNGLWVNPQKVENATDTAAGEFNWVEDRLREYGWVAGGTVDQQAIKAAAKEVSQGRIDLSKRQRLTKAQKKELSEIDSRFLAIDKYKRASNVRRDVEMVASFSGKRWNARFLHFMRDGGWKCLKPSMFWKDCLSMFSPPPGRTWLRICWKDPVWEVDFGGGRVITHQSGRVEHLTGDEEERRKWSAINDNASKIVWELVALFEGDPATKVVWATNEAAFVETPIDVSIYVMDEIQERMKAFSISIGEVDFLG